MGGCGGDEISLLLFEGTRFSEAGLALENLAVCDIGGEGGGWSEATAEGRTAVVRGGAVEGSANAPEVGAVMAAEPKRGSKELSIGSRLLHQRHIVETRLGASL